MTICVIPARSGSKRLKNKNIKSFNGKPIISYAIKIAKSSKLFSRIIVSTDCKKIKSIAEKYGAEVPFLRSKKLSDDYTITADVIIDAIKKISSENCQYHFCIYPTTTLISKFDLLRAFKKIKTQKSDLLLAVSEFNKNPLRALQIVKKNNIKFWNKKFANFRTQDLPKFYKDSGSFYIYDTKSLFKNKGQLTKNSTFYMLNKKNSVDIDNIFDFKIAEYLYKVETKN